MMRFHPAILTLAALAGSSLSAQAATAISENITGTVSGANTTDTLGLFGPAGANLSGKTIGIHYQYVENFFGASKPCRFGGCTLNSSSGSPNTPGAVLITITVNGKGVTYTSTYFGRVLFGTTSSNLFYIYADTDSFGLGLRGAVVSTSFSAPVTFGSTISPANQPVHNYNSDFVEFFTPDNQLPSESLNFVAVSATN